MLVDKTALKINNELLLCLIIFIPSVIQVIKVILGIKIVEVTIGLYLSIFLVSILSNLKIDKFFLKFISLFLLIDLILWMYTFAFNLMQNPNILLKMFVQHFGLVIPIFCVASNLKDLRYFSKLVYWFALFFSILFILIYITLGRVSIEIDYDMTLGYILVFLCITLVSEKITLRSIFLSACMLMLSLKFGSRGLIGVFLAFLFTRFCYCGFKTKLLLMGLGFLSLCGIYILYIFGLFGDSRTIRLLTNKDTLLYVSGRDRIFESLEPFLVNSPFFGNGIGIDRIVMNNYGLYAHNIFIESIVEMGVIIPFVFCLYKASKFLKFYKFAPLIVFFAMSCSLLYSESFWTDRNFWVFCGLLRSYLINCIEENKE